MQITNNKTWFQALHDCEQQGLAYVLVTLLFSSGSTPRNAGTKMVVSADNQYDTIGGGHLEYNVIKKAREYLAQGESIQKTESYPLASKLGQCCGGAVKVLFEVMVTHQQKLAIFGAGHVAQALVPIVAQLPIQIDWVDNRESFFTASSHAQSPMSSAMSIAQTYSNVNSIVNDDPCEEVTLLAPKSWVVILTHNHQLDYDLVKTALKHKHLDFIGMIGSQTKAKRFIKRLNHRGFLESDIKKLVTPIGDMSIPGKLPIEVAVSISSQLISLLHVNDTPKNEIKARIKQTPCALLENNL
jgi:xanthine dehydrogenase accessory factor